MRAVDISHPEPSFKRGVQTELRRDESGGFSEEVSIFIGNWPLMAMFEIDEVPPEAFKDNIHVYSTLPYNISNSG